MRKGRLEKTKNLRIEQERIAAADFEASRNWLLKILRGLQQLTEVR